MNQGLILLNMTGFSPKKCADILLRLQNPEELLDLSGGYLQERTGISLEEVRRIQTCRDKELDREIKFIEREGIFILDIFDKQYPALLKEISFPPLILYTKGDIDLLNRVCFGIVGTRLATPYGLNTAQEFGRALAAKGLVIVSGMAKGIDAAGHIGALESGTTIAVIGSGLLNLYPIENISLAKRIEKQGLLISEFPVYCPPLKENFPRRNRIVSGLSQGVLVIEAASRSGALITAHLALEQNRSVFALPGAIDSPFSKGTHSLIKEGAKLVDSVEDIWEELNLAPIREKTVESKQTLNLNEEAVLAVLTRDGTCLEDICAQSGFQPQHIHQIVFDLQIKGLVKEVKPSCFIRSANL